MAKDYLILQSTNFACGNNAHVLCIVKNINSETELRQHVVAQFENLKACVMNNMPEESFSGDVFGMYYTLTQDYDDGSTPLIYEVYAIPMPNQSVKVTNIEWDTNGKDIDLPTECIIEVPYDASTEQIVGKLSDEYGWCVKCCSVNER